MPIIYNHQTADHAKGLIAIIDIGSNSVRMVVYHALKRVPLPVFNEKYMCALGKGMGHTGRLNEEGVVHAKRVIARFLLMAQRLDVARLDVLATAAVRDAEDGTDFVHYIEDTHGICVKVISGEEEARYAALGIMASIHAPLGLSADLGGGSLELASISPSSVSEVVSLPIGSLRLLDGFGNDTQKMQTALEKQFAKITWLNELYPPSLYAIGGGFRTLAKIHMKQKKYPLNLTHEYEIKAKDALSLAEEIIQMDDKSLKNLPGLSPKRLPTIKPSAVVLKALLKHTKAESMITSVSGIREGFFFDMLEEKKQAEDPLIASAADLAALIGRRGRYAAQLFDWVQPLFTHEPLAFTRIRRALCILSELAWSIDPNFRAEWAYMRIMQSSLKGLTHHERIMLALALFHRYQTSMKQKPPGIGLLNEYEMLWARACGLSVNLAFQLSGGKEGNLSHARLSFRNHQPFLWVDAEASPLRTEIVEKRLDGLGKTFSALLSLDA